MPQTPEVPPQPTSPPASNLPHPPKHTPEPWDSKPFNEDWLITAKDPSGGITVVASVHFQGETLARVAEQDANLALFLLAPRLARFVKQVYTTANFLGGSLERATQYQQLFEELKALLAELEKAGVL